ncbi:MAG: PLP-dependent transferase, partial [Rubricella sp.]
GRCLGGVILGPREIIRKTVEPYMKHTGGAMSPFNAWVLLNGLQTMDLRVRAQAESAARLADALAHHGKVERVLFPARPDHPQHGVARRQMEGGGTIVTIDVAGGQEGAFRFLDALNVFLISNNLGDAKSIATHPRTTTHQRLSEEARLALGIHPGTVRLSIGLEDARDLEADLLAALSRV